VNGIGRFTPFEDDLVATKRVASVRALQHPPLLQVDPVWKDSAPATRVTGVDVEVAYLGAAGKGSGIQRSDVASGARPNGRRGAC